MQFTPLDLSTWPRGQMFRYFSDRAPTGYSISVNTDITALRQTLKAAGMKFFPAYIWLVTKCLNEQIEFKIAREGERLGYYDTLTPLYASFHEDDKTFSLMWTPYDEDFSTFYRNYLHNQQVYGGQHGVLSQTQALPPPNSYTVSCIPWVSFDHFAVHSYDNKPYYFPSVEAGKFSEIGGKLMMPLSLTCHHATTDGWHVHLFLDRLQEEMNRFGDHLG